MSELRTIRYLPLGIERYPTSVLEALIAARAVLEEEGRWMQGEWFTNAHPEVDPEDPFCNAWSVCAEGAVGLVTFGVELNDYGTGDRTPAELVQAHMMPYVFGYQHAEADSVLYRQTNEALRRAAVTILIREDRDGVRHLTHDQFEDMHGVRSVREYYDELLTEANDYNDSHISTRTQALEWFDVAIAEERERGRTDAT